MARFGGFLQNKKRLVVLGILVLLVGFGAWKIFGQKSSLPTYQTTRATTGTIVATLTASGTVATANSAQVTTAASGVVTKVDVQNGDVVAAGDPIAELNLDLVGQQRNQAALASYQSAKNNLFSLQSTMLTKWNTYMGLAQNSTYQNADGSPNSTNRVLPQFMSPQDDWLAAEAAYNTQQITISQNYLSYLQSAPTIYAPISGTVTGLGLQVGSVITAQSNSNGGASTQKIASIITQATPTVTLSLTEVDVPKVKVGEAATMTLDAYPGKTFTGKIISIDTVGTVTSGVTTYPAVIKFDDMAPGILTNMSVTANIITGTAADVLMVPTSAVTTTNGTSTVRVLKNNTLQVVPVEIGLASTTETAITSGLTEGDEVVTSVVSSTTPTGSQNTTSPFGGGLGGGGARFIRGG